MLDSTVDNSKGSPDLNIDSKIPSPDFDLLNSYRQNYKAFRERILARSLLPLAFLEIFPKPNCRVAVANADSLLAHGWKMNKTPVIPLKPPIPWSINPRSFECHLHAWLPIQRLLIAFDLDKSWRYFQAALEIAEDWIIACPIQLGKKSLADAVALIVEEYKEGSWWYDMSIAQRLNQLAYIVDICCRNPEINDERIFAMMDHILVHHMVLSLDLFYKSHTNHGFFQALNQYAAIKRLPEFDHDKYLFKMVRKRFNEMTEQQYTNNMIHREHSPGYHYMVTVALMNAYRAELLDIDENTKVKLQRAEENLGWMTMPSGQIVTFGDTDPRNLFNQREAVFFEEASLVAMLSGEKQLTGVKKFVEEGYAFARLYGASADKSKPQQASYFAQMSAFHSRVHKQADHLTFVWFDYGRDILTDTGRFAYAGKTMPGSELFEEGFWYADPKRIYCESTRSHNCVVIDGKNYQRKGVKPFGSALIDAREENGMVVTDCEVWHFKTVKHRRRIVMKPGHFLVVLDWLYDRSGEQHEYVQRFLFDAPWYVAKEGEIVRAFHSGGENVGGEEGGPLYLCAGTAFENAEIIPIVRGQEEPELLGWISDEPNSLIPACSMGVRAIADGPHSFCTIFTLSETLEIDKSKSRTNSSKTTGTVVWKDDFGTHNLKFIPIEGIVRFEIESV